MFQRVPSIRLKMMLIVMITCFAALTLAAFVLVLYDVRSHRESWVRDLMTQAEMVGQASAPAVVFGDTLTAHQNLAMLSVRPEVLAAAVYSRDGALFARYATRAGEANFPVGNRESGYRFTGNHLEVFKTIDDPDGRVGLVYLSVQYDLAGRLWHYLPVVMVVMLGSLLVALAMTYRLQSSVARPIVRIAHAADEVRTRRDFSLRVERDTSDETGKLADAFNAMLAEVAEAERSLRESNQRKDQFLATLAHELRNPLGPIRNAAQYLRIRDTNPASQPSLELIDRQVEHMVRLIEDLLDISRITRDALELRFSYFSAGDLVRDVLEATQFAAEDAGLELRSDVAMPNVQLYADRARLVQVVSNIVNNAIKFTLRGGRIDLRLAPRGRNLTITVTDTGIGIPPSQLGEIFEPFSQIDRSLEKTRGGLGIGLALSRQLVGLHGGTLEARSEGPGKGSTFQALLPIVTESNAKAQTEGAPSYQTNARYHVLVADDNVDGAESLGLLLQHLGYTVDIAHDGAEALACIDQGRFAAAILDIGMPRLNGYDVARQLRARGHGLLLVALTGWGQNDDRQRAFDAGFDSHLTKPVTLDQLTQTLSALSQGDPAPRG